MIAVAPLGLGRDGHLTPLGVDRAVCDPPETHGHEALTGHLATCAICQARVAAVTNWTAELVAPSPPGFNRDGHLTALTAERLVLEPEATDLHWARGHLASCSACGLQHDALRISEMPTLPAARRAPTQSRPSLSQRLPRPSWRGIAGGVAIAAALALFVWRPQTQQQDASLASDLRAKGSALDLEVFAHDGTQSRRVESGDTVRVGEHLGFRLLLRQSAHVMIVGADQFGHAYLCYPYTPDGASRKLPAMSDAETLDDAVEMDEVEGAERLVALACRAPFAFDALAARLAAMAIETPPADDLPPLLTDCVQREIVLRKTSAADGGEP